MLYARNLASERKYNGILYGWGWLRKFLKRHRLSLRKPSSTYIKPFELIRGKIEEFIKEIRELIASGLYEKDFIFNLDETSIATEATNEKTIEQKGLKRVKANTVGKQKDCHTVLLGGTLTGKKLPAMIIIKGAGVKTLKTIPKNIVVRYREEGSWMDKERMKNYIRTVLKYWAEDIPKEKRGLLLIDNFKGHIDKDIEDQFRELRIDVKRLPSNTSAYLQPLDLTVNASFKRFYAESWDEYQFGLDLKPLTKKGQNYKPPEKEDKVLWISQAWEKISKEAIANGFNCYLQEQSIENFEKQALEDQIDVGLELSETIINDIESLKVDLDDGDLEDGDDLSDLCKSGAVGSELLDYEIYPDCEND